jgi:D-sedoheptulose 7-phosphate isomerase
VNCDDSITLIRQRLNASAEVKQRVAAACAPAIAEAAVVLIEAFQRGGKLLLCGNGGSAADCQHLAAEFVNGLDHVRPRPALGAIALTTDTSFLTANANDFGFEQVFERQVEAHGHSGDVLLAISTSGDSPNVLRALARARGQSMKTVLLTGESGGKAGPMANVVIRVPNTDTQRIQEAHITVGHIICELVDGALFPTPGGSD